MEKLLPETLKIFNTRLEDAYGRTDDKANFRVIWSEDEFEHRWSNYSLEGFELVRPEVQYRPKYKQWVQDKYILERLTAVPAVQENDLVQVLSYEPLWVFENNQGATVPTMQVLRFIVENTLRAIETQGYVKYKDPEAKQDEALELQQMRVEELIKELYGNETEVGDALSYKEGVTVPSTYIKQGE